MEIPKHLQQGVFRFVLLNGKKPIENDWPRTANYQFDNAKLLQHIANGGNYGVCGGFGDLLIVDFDDKVVEERLISKMPKGFSVRTGRGGTHKYFICKNAESVKVLHTNGDTIADIQGPGKQCVGPGSIHPDTKRSYEVLDNSPIPTIDFSEIKAFFGDWLKPEKQEFRKRGEITKDPILDEIKSKKSMPELLQHYDIDISRNPTRCKWHSSRGGQCMSFNDELFHCFHCGKGGDIFNYVMFEEKCDFPEAKRKLAEMVGITMVGYKINKASGAFSRDYIDLAKEFYNTQPYFFDNGGVWWLWNFSTTSWKMIDEVALLRAIYDAVKNYGMDITQNNIRSQLLTAMKIEGRGHIPKDMPKTWIQFQDKIFDVSAKQLFDATPEYFVCNPIPWKIGDSEETPTLQKAFEDWVGLNNVDSLFQIISYCCVADYPIHLILCLLGSGRNGKSTFQTILRTFLGVDNVSSSELDTLLTSRFESVKLYKKLVCSVGETNFTTLKNSTFLKKISGQDLIGFEIKGKTPFDGINYAKVVISSNSLPPSLDTSDGFYRRWLIIDFPNQFPEGKDFASTIPEIEYNNLALKVTKILPGLLEEGKLKGQGTIEQRREKYILASNPLPLFLDKACEKGIGKYVRYSELLTAYCEYLQSIKRRVVQRKEFDNVLLGEGLERRRTTKEDVSDYYVEGISLFPDWKEKMQKMQKMQDSFLSSYIGEKK